MARSRDEDFAEEPLPPEDDDRGPPRRRRRYDDDDRPAKKSNATLIIVLSVVGVVVVLCAGCGIGGYIFVQNAQARVKRMNEMKMIGLAFHNFEQNHNRAPNNAGELRPFLQGSPDEAAAWSKLDDGTFVFIYGVSVKDMGKLDGASRTVLAYEKEAPSNGGIVLLGDGGVEQKSAAEFNSMPKARKPEQ